MLWFHGNLFSVVAFWCIFPHCELKLKFRTIVSRKIWWKINRYLNVTNVLIINCEGNSWYLLTEWDVIHHLCNHSVEKRKIHCHAKFFSLNQFTVKFFIKTLIWRKICEITMAVKFRFSTVWQPEVAGSTRRHQYSTQVIKSFP